MRERLLELGPHRLRVSDSAPAGGSADVSAGVPADGSPGVPADGAAPPLLLINGIGANLEMWEPLRQRLSRRTVAIDLPGTGGSSTPLLPLSIGDDARLLLRAMDQLGLATVDVLGFSFGGSVAQELAHQAPDRVRRLVLVSTSCGWGSVPGSPLALALLSNPLRYYSPAFFKTFAPVLVGGRGARNERFLDRQAARRAARPPSALGYLYQTLAASSWTSWPWLHTLRQPTLIVTGGRDQVVPAINARMMAWALPHARLRTWRYGGHMLLLDSASRVAPEIEDFLQADVLRPEPLAGDEGLELDDPLDGEVLDGEAPDGEVLEGEVVEVVPAVAPDAVPRRGRLLRVVGRRG